MYDEDDLLPISALQHLEYCPRRCALIHIEGLWRENAQTAEGRVLHERVHAVAAETIGNVRSVRGLRLASRRLGLFGVADVVEFHPVDDPAEPAAVVPGLAGRWRPYPVEYKRGRRKPEISYLVQFCAQALCLEEMLQTSVPAGALYHGKSRRRQAVDFDATLRARTEERIGQLHALIAAGQPPPPRYGPKCKFCSLAEICVPKLSASRSARGYLTQAIQSLLKEGP
jgi:CRISPR-associated exonuclease Cas4